MVNINKEICNYISSEWVSNSVSYRNFALDHNIDEKIVRKIITPEGYNIPVATLQKICEARRLKLSEFFALIGR